jgi:hypothetical protein
MAEVFEVEDSDFGGGAWVPWKCVLPPPGSKTEANAFSMV